MNESGTASGGGARSRDRFEEAADLVGRMPPAVCLALDQLLQHRDGHRLLRGRPVFQGAGNRRYSRIADALGQLPADLEVGVDAGLQAPEQLEDQPIAVDEGRVALLAGQPADVERAVAAEHARTPLVCTGAQRAAPRADVLLLLERLEQRAAEAVVEPRVEEHALARAGHPRQHRVRRTLFDAARFGGRANRQRQEIAVPLAVLVVDFDDGDEQRLRRRAAAGPSR